MQPSFGVIGLRAACTRASPGLWGLVVILKVAGNHHPRGGKLADQVSGSLRALVESRREQVI